MIAVIPEKDKEESNRSDFRAKYQQRATNKETRCEDHWKWLTITCIINRVDKYGHVFLSMIFLQRPFQGSDLDCIYVAANTVVGFSEPCTSETILRCAETRLVALTLLSDSEIRVKEKEKRKTISVLTDKAWTFLMMLSGQENELRKEIALPRHWLVFSSWRQLFVLPSRGALCEFQQTLRQISCCTHFKLNSLAFLLI